VLPSTELTDRPGRGRTYAEMVRPAIADAGPTGRVRLDAIARWLQDAAYYDLVDAGWERPAPWLVRRLRIRVERFPVLPERLTLETWCSGIGPAIAERRTRLRGEDGARVEAAALWISIDPGTQRPAPLTDAFMAVYAASADGRRSRTRLRHAAAPSAGAVRSAFTFRAADLDPVHHVNNAAYWAVLEEELGDRAADEPIDAEVEHRSATGPGTVEVHADGAGGRWVVADGAVVATFAVA
jgi:acyl-ACP thioesterase